MWPTGYGRRGVKVIRRISGFIFAVSLFWAWGTVGLADMGEFHPYRLMGRIAVAALSGFAWLITKEENE